MDLWHAPMPLDPIAEGMTQRLGAITAGRGCEVKAATTTMVEDMLLIPKITCLGESFQPSGGVILYILWMYHVMIIMIYIYIYTYTDIYLHNVS